jgi:hypothetical protein
MILCVSEKRHRGKEDAGQDFVTGESWVVSVGYHGFVLMDVVVVICVECRKVMRMVKFKRKSNFSYLLMNKHLLKMDRRDFLLNSAAMGSALTFRGTSALARANRFWHLRADGQTGSSQK